jgi:hypothetical protein
VQSFLDLALGAYRGKGTGEHGLLRQLMHCFQAGDVVLGDSYYCTFFLIATLNRIGADAAFPIHGARDCDFRSGERLGKKDHRVRWLKPQRPSWMDKKTYNDFPDEITVREVDVSTERKGHCTEKRVLVTTFLDSVAVTKKDLLELYDRRWLVELDLRAIKNVMKMDVLRGQTPEMVHKEIWAHLLAYNLIRKVMAQAAIAHEKNPRQMSFKLALQAINSFRQAGLFSEANKAAHAILLKTIAYKKTGNRRGRWEPRRVKRRPKPFARLQKPRQVYQREMATN